MKSNNAPNNASDWFLALSDPLPFEVNEELLAPRMGFMEPGERSAYGGNAHEGTVLMYRLIEFCWITMEDAPTGRLQVMASLDCFACDDLKVYLAEVFGSCGHPFKKLMSGSELAGLKKLLAEQSTDFKPIASEVIAILNTYFPPKKGMRKSGNARWNAWRRGIYAACERLNARFLPPTKWVKRRNPHKIAG